MQIISAREANERWKSNYISRVDKERCKVAKIIESAINDSIFSYCYINFDLSDEIIEELRNKGYIVKIFTEVDMKYNGGYMYEISF